MGCLAKDRNGRPASAAVLRAALLACADARHNDVAAAQAWWQARRAALKDHPRPLEAIDSVGSRPATMAIDLGARGATALKTVA
jgi:hypothetical protein